MVYKSTKKYIDSLTLNDETSVLAALALELAQVYDETKNTSTAGELRKTLNELRRMFEAQPGFDPLEELLTR